ncbi:MAG: hypothetical protein Q8L84_09995 [Hyphomonas sp.]|nr:hypothetical protein [Hyphomonas sp.]
MTDTSRFNVWSEHIDEADVSPVECLRAESALLLVLAAAHDEGCLIDGASLDDFDVVAEDWLVRDLGTRQITRYRSTVSLPSDFGIGIAFTQLRACRVCGCIDERACEGGCEWVGADLCSACVPDADSAREGGD